MNADPSEYATDDPKRAAAIAAAYMSGANSGGLNYFLTYSYDLAAREVLDSLEALGASIAAAQLKVVLDRIGDPLVASTEEARWDQLDSLWTNELDEYDILTEEADQDLIIALTTHVEGSVEFYLHMAGNE